eukprot:9580530-Ditylum_brightwellii.AAC.1
MPLTTAASIAKQTIKSHTEKVCWGCRDTGHPFMAKGGKVLCPKAHLPEVRANADRKCADFKANKRKRGEKRKTKDVGKILASAFKDWDKADIRAFVMKMQKKESGKNDKDEWKSFPLFAIFLADTIKPTLPIS